MSRIEYNQNQVPADIAKCLAQIVMTLAHVNSGIARADDAAIRIYMFVFFLVRIFHSELFSENYKIMRNDGKDECLQKTSSSLKSLTKKLQSHFINNCDPPLRTYHSIFSSIQKIILSLQCKTFCDCHNTSFNLVDFLMKFTQSTLTAI